jgi:hypothetical protein
VEKKLRLGETQEQFRDCGGGGGDTSRAWKKLWTMDLSGRDECRIWGEFSPYQVIVNIKLKSSRESCFPLNFVCVDGIVGNRKRLMEQPQSNT